MCIKRKEMLSKRMKAILYIRKKEILRRKAILSIR